MRPGIQNTKFQHKQRKSAELKKQAAKFRDGKGSSRASASWQETRSTLGSTFSDAAY